MSVLDSEPSEKFDPHTVRRTKPLLLSVCRKPCYGGQWSFSRASKESQRTKGAKAQQHIEPTPYYIAPLFGSTHFPQISPPMPLNFSMKATIFWNTLCFFVTYSGWSGLNLGSASFRSVPFSLANSCRSDVRK